MDGSEVCDQDRIDLHLPMGGKWFFKQALALQEFYKQNKTGFVCAWDTHPVKGSKVYGVYKTVTHFHDALVQSSGSHWYAYELIPENIPCHFYADIEWVGREDYDHAKIQWIVQRFQAEILREFKKKVSFQVSCATRMTDGINVYKNSYHLVSQNIIFRSNSDGRLKDFITQVVSKPEERAQWFVGDKCVVDLGVYTKNRCFRTLSSSKLGKDCPFVFMRLEDTSFIADPHDTRNFVSMVVSCPSARLCDIQEPKLVTDSAAAPAPFRRPLQPLNGNRVLPAAGAAVSNRPLPFPVSIIQDILADFGDTHTRITSCTYVPDVTTGTPKWKLYGSNDGHARPCVLNPEVQHKSNNCLIFVAYHEESDDAAYTVKYVCMSKRGHTSGADARADIARVSFHSRLDKWVFRKLLRSDDRDSDEFAEVSGADEDEDDYESVIYQPSHQDADDAQERQRQMQRQRQQQREQQEQQDDEDEEEEQQEEDGYDSSADITHGSPENHTYDIVKYHFEKKTFKLENPFLYVRIQNLQTGEYQLLKHNELRQFNSHKYCYVATKDPEMPWKKKEFIPMWLKDPNKRKCLKIVMDPLSLDENVFNLWRGFLCDKLPVPMDISPEDAAAPIIRHIHEVVTNEVQAHTEWFMDWMANIVQRPTKKTMVAIVLFGKQGCGKNIIFDWFCKQIIGKDHSFQTANPENDCFSRFATGFKGNVFVQIDETKNLHAYSERLKHVITGDNINIEQKGKDIISVQNLTNLLFTTNNEDALLISGDDRRMCMFRCSSRHKDNKPYFAQLSVHLHEPGVNAAFFHFLKQRDLSAYPHDFQASRPITEFYEECRNLCIRLEKRFLSGIVHHRNDTIRSYANDLYLRYQEWAGHENARYQVTRNRFGTAIKRVQGVTFERDAVGILYHIDCPVVRQFLINSKEFDSDVVINYSYS